MIPSILTPDIVFICKKPWMGFDMESEKIANNADRDPKGAFSSPMTCTEDVAFLLVPAVSIVHKSSIGVCRQNGLSKMMIYAGPR